MHRAFEAVCVTLQLSITSDDKVTALVGEKIIELAVAGERDVKGPFDPGITPSQPHGVGRIPHDCKCGHLGP